MAPEPTLYTPYPELNDVLGGSGSIPHGRI